MENRTPQAKSRKSQSGSRQPNQQHTPIYSFNDEEFNVSKKDKLNSSSRDDFNSDNGSLFQVVLRPNRSGLRSNTNNNTEVHASKSGGPNRRILDRSPDRESSKYGSYINDNDENTSYVKASKRQNRREREAEKNLTQNYSNSNANDVDESPLTAKRPPVTPRKLRGNESTSAALHNNDVHDKSDPDLNSSSAVEQPTKSTTSRENRQMSRSKSNLNKSASGLNASYDSAHYDDANNRFTSVNTHGQKIILRGIFTFDGRSVDLELYQNFIKWKSISGN
jgi:hypothetical protein